MFNRHFFTDQFTFIDYYDDNDHDDDKLFLQNG